LSIGLLAPSRVRLGRKTTNTSSEYEHGCMPLFS